MSQSFIVLCLLVFSLVSCGKKEVPPPQPVRFTADLFDKDRTLVKTATMQHSLEKSLRMNLDYVYNVTKGHAYDMNVITRNGSDTRYLEISNVGPNFDVPPSKPGTHEKMHLLQDPQAVVMTFTLLPNGEIYGRDNSEEENVKLGYYFEAKDYFVITDLCTFNRSYTDNCRVRKAKNNTFHSASVDIFNYYDRRQNARVTILEDLVAKNHREVMGHIERLSKDLNKQRDEIEEMKRFSTALQKTVEANRLFAATEITAAKSRLVVLESGLKTAQADLVRIDTEGKETATELDKTKMALAATDIELGKVRDSLKSEVKRLEGDIEKVRMFTQEVLDTHKADFKKLDDKLAAAVAKLETAQKEAVEQLRRELKALSDRLKLAEDSLLTKATAADLVKTQTDVMKLKELATTIDGKLTMHMKAFDTYTTETKVTLDGLRKDVDALKAALKKDVEALTKNITDLETKLEGRLKDEVAKLRKEVEAIDARLKTAEATLLKKAEVTELAKAQTDLKKAQDELVALTKRYEDYVRATDKRVGALEVDVEALKKKAMGHDTTLQGLQTQITALDGKLIKLAMDTTVADTARKTSIDGLKVEVGKVAGEIKPLKDTLAAIDLTLKNVATAADLKKANDLIVGLTKKLEDQGKAVDLLKTRIDALEKLPPKK